MNADKLLSLVRMATLAPSSHNTQPWLFRVTDRYIDVVADPTRSLPENDPSGRELTISCGCALMNLRIAALHAGLQPEVEYFPDFGDPTVLARVEFSERDTASDDDPSLVEAITKRWTYRRPFADRAVPDLIIRGMVQEVTREGGWLVFLSDQQRADIGRLVAEGAAAQWSRRSWRRELARWTRPRAARDGLVTSTVAGPLTRFVIRSFNLGRRIGAQDKSLAEQAPLLAVLGTYGDAAADWLVAGQALQRLLLRAAGLGVQASFLNQPVQVGPLREQLERLMGVAGFPQIVLRLGYPTEQIAAPPRRSVGDVTSVRTTRTSG
jgi:hypothetical protein